MLERRARIAIVVSILLASFPAAVAGPTDEATDADSCPDLEYMVGVGDVCKRGPGEYELFAADGRSLGFTHGPDPICEGCPEMVSTTGSTTPHCVSASATDYYVHVIYARAHNDADRYSTMAPQIRTLVQNANAMVDDAAIATGDRLSIRVLCSAGTIVVANEVLPTSMASATYTSIINDLNAKGYNSHRHKYWVYYDDAGACSCAGIGHRYNDDSNSVNNANNGPSSSIGMFAISFNSNSVRTMLHELGHNLGAVHNSAPYGSGAGHCYDGLDIMCYDDNGPNSGSCVGFYCTGYCSVEVFDCNKNTYCNANPTSGSYLATRWQACHRQTRFLQYAANTAPVMTALSCTPSNPNVGTVVTCSFSATDENVGVYYTVNWGDGSANTRVPASGTVAPGTTQSSTHSWSTQGGYTVSVTATDSGTPTLTSTPRTLAVTIGPPNDVPTTTSLSCTPTTANEGEIVTCSVTGTDPTHNVSYTINWGDGSPTTRLPSAGVVSSGTMLSAGHGYGDGGSFTVSATTTDDGSPPLTSPALTFGVTINAINSRPVLTAVSCPSMTTASATCTFTATDVDSSQVRYRVEWGDGSVSYVPSASGYVAPGTSQSATHSYAAEGSYTVNVTATDDFVPPDTSTVATRVITVQTDMTGPAVTVTEPLGNSIYIGCARQSKLVGAPLFVRIGCVKAVASDPSGVERVEVRYNGAVIATDTAAPYVMEFPVPGVRIGAVFEVRAYDTKGNMRSTSFEADMV